jgi:hypothetical protein
MEKLAKDTHTSLLQKFANYVRKKSVLTNTLAYYKCSYITSIESFISLCPGPNVIKLFVHNHRTFVLS